MLEYIYFVKCPNCEDEHFFFFDEAKECAMSQLSKKPIITQVEVNRNDFGECTDSADLGTIWSWEDMMKDVPAAPEQTVFTKADTINCCDDHEFNNLDNALTEDYNWVYIDYDKKITKEELYTELVNKNNVVVVNIGDQEAYDVRFEDHSRYSDSEFHINYTNGKFTVSMWHNSDDGDNTDDRYYEFETESFDELWDELTGYDTEHLVENRRKPVPANMSIDDLVEAMEVNEDDVECKWCNELFDKSECRYEVDLGWLCDSCQQAIKSRGETLTFREGPIDEDYSKDPRDLVELEYPELTVTLYGSKRDVDDWDEVEHTDSHVFLVPRVEVATAIWENWITDEDVADVEGGLETLEDDKAWEDFLKTHFDTLFEKYNKEILEYFRDEAEEDFRERAQEEYSMDQWSASADRAFDEWRDERYFGESKSSKPFLEELEDAEDYRKHLADCPECGFKESFDHETGICINCGFNI
jgi:hypothetical protein